jgi:synaptosomal-associated protein 29
MYERIFLINYFTFRLDEINSTLNNSERHLTGMKSVFGGIRNYLFAKRNGIQTTATQGQMSATPAIQTSQNETSSAVARNSSFGGNGASNVDNYHPGNKIQLYFPVMCQVLN